MNLLDAYISEVGRRLPIRSRADIEAEIRSALQDMLDEKSRAAGKPIDDAMTLDVLKAYGDPEKVAASYRGERYLIGPKLYPTFERVVTIVLPIVVILGLVGMGINLSRQSLSGMDVITVIAQTLANLVWSVISAVGSIAFIFAVIERTVPEFKLKTPVREWDPRSLYRVTPSDRPKVGSLIVDIFFTSMALILFNFFPQLFHMSFYPNGGWWFVFTNQGNANSIPLLSPVFFNYLPFLDLIWVATIVLSILVLALGRWQTWSRWGYIAIKVLTVVLAAIMLTGPSVIAVTAQDLMAGGIPSLPVAEMFVNIFDQIWNAALILTIIFGAVDVIRTLVRMVRPALPIIERI